MFEPVMYEDSGPAMKCHRGGDLLNVPVAVECGGGLLRHGPIADAGFKSVSIGPGWMLLNLMPRLPTSLDNAWVKIFTLLGSRVGYQPGGLDAVANGRADRDDAAAVFIALTPPGCGHGAAHVDIDHTIHLFECGLFEGFRDRCAGHCS